MIRISQLSKSFSGQVVLDHLDLEVQKGSRCLDRFFWSWEINLLEKFELFGSPR